MAQLGTGFNSPLARTRFMLAGIFLLALTLRLYCLNCYSLWFDEVPSIEVAQLGMNAVFTYRFGWIGNQTLLYYLLVWLTIQPVDPATTAALVRLPSALAGALAVLPVYGLGREMFGRAQGILAALLVALSAVHTNYPQDIRPYAMLTFLTAASVYCLLLAERTNLAQWWLAFAVTSTVSLLISYFAPTLVLPALLPYLLWLAWQLWLRKEASRTSSSLPRGKPY